MIDKNNLKISSTLFEFINKEAIPGTNINEDEFWSNFSKYVHELSPINKKLIEERENIQKKIDEWHKSKSGSDFNNSEYINPMLFNQINNLDDNVNEKWLYNNLTILFSTLNFSTWHSTFIENDFRKFLV